MTVSDLRKQLKGVDGKLIVYTADHDQSEYETNGIVNFAFVVDQSENEYDVEDIFKIEGKYFVLRP